MEPTNQPFRKENDLPNLHGGTPLFKEHGRFEQCTSQDMAELQIKVLPHFPFPRDNRRWDWSYIVKYQKYIYSSIFNSLIFFATVKLVHMHI